MPKAHLPVRIATRPPAYHAPQALLPCWTNLPPCAQGAITLAHHTHIILPHGYLLAVFELHCLNLGYPGLSRITSRLPVCIPALRGLWPASHTPHASLLSASCVPPCDTTCAQSSA